MHDFRLVYERKCPFTLRLRDSDLKDKLGQDFVDEQEELIVKLLVKGPDDRPDCVRIELFSLNDYFFMYCHEATPAIYKKMKETDAEHEPWNQRQSELKPDYKEYLTHLIKLFNNVIEQEKNEQDTKKKLMVSYYTDTEQGGLTLLFRRQTSRRKIA